MKSGKIWTTALSKHHMRYHQDGDYSSYSKPAQTTCTNVFCMYSYYCIESELGSRGVIEWSLTSPDFIFACGII